MFFKCLSFRLLVIAFLSLLFASCGTGKKAFRDVDFASLARAGLKLGVDIDVDDDWPLMLEASSWIGVPYRYGGTNKSGVDCSGLTVAIYRNVYGIGISRNSHAQYDNDVKKVSKKKLKTGNLVFFATGKKSKVSHVGVYLKDDKFIHASSSRGVVVSDLKEEYYKRSFVSGGIVK
jgi:lipoprotein Spr